MQTKGGIRKRPQRRRGTLPILNPPAVTLQKLLYPGTPLCNLEAKDPAATLAHLGWREKHPLWSQAETGSDPGSTSGLGWESSSQAPPSSAERDKPSSAAGRRENAPTGPEQDQARDMPQAKAVYPSAFRGTVLASKGPSGDVLMA